MRYTHTNLDSKRAAAEKLPGHCDKSVHSMHRNSAITTSTVTLSGRKLQCFKKLKSEGWVGG